MSLPDILTGNTAFDRSPLRGLPTPAFCTIAARALFGEVNATSLFVRMAQFWMSELQGSELLAEL
jgi:hypothetical protein